MKTITSSSVNWVKKENCSESCVSRMLSLLIQHFHASDPFIPRLCETGVREIIENSTTMPSHVVSQVAEFLIDRVHDVSNQSKLNQLSVVDSISCDP